MKASLMTTGVLSLALAAGCAGDPNQRAKQGAAIGAIAGAVAGHQVDGDKGRYIGAIVGLAAGAGIGHYMDRQQAELERRLAEERAAQQLQITRLPDGSLKVGVASQASFDVDSATIKPQFQGTFAQIATVLRDFPSTVVHVVGHTDSTGAANYNQGLSERRASAVSNLFLGQGVQGGRLRSEGRGEREPIASNTTAEGRTRNRRVDIVIKPVIEGQEQQAFQPPGYLGS